ncbi:hypothetical protein BC939DRAFT_227691 [Gamsiella multidivaricata]|uniref:uncharacterized protein n=1 Tax=Gamsiella multidivaricata TaxID=101098 RepID=UPI00221FEE06|nr:uncharacterized protein BC939DRAFT_227691 [Gamsiella multidivaricata]KAI7820638.1 hypothetical protein BC939DRAFT_227691 [Gamsiella multidivaricata]
MFTPPISTKATTMSPSYPSTSSPSCTRFTPSMPPECLERIVFHAAQDHRVLSTLMQVNSTLFRIATPYLYREAFIFKFGDEFLLDWDTEAWTQHLREVRHAKLLLLYLACTDTVQTLLTSGSGGEGEGGRGGGSWRNKGKGAAADLKMVHKYKYLCTTTTNSTSSHSKLQRDPTGSHASALSSASFPERESDGSRRHSLPPPPPVERIPRMLEDVLRSYMKQGSTTSTTASPTTGRRRSVIMFSCKKDDEPRPWAPKPHTVNYLDYVEHLELDSFLSTSIQVLFSTSAASFTGSKPLSKISPQPHLPMRENSYTEERAFTERVLLQSTAQHITTLSLSVATFARLQRELMDYVLDTPSAFTSSHDNKCSSSSPSSSCSPASKNSAGIRTGAPLSQLSRISISGLHAELKPKVLRAIRWFVRRHVLTYPGVLTSIVFDGPGDTIVNRRRQRNRNVVGVEPILPGVVHFNNQYTNNDDTDEVEEYDGAPTSNSPSGVLFVDATGHINNIFNGNHNVATEAFPADFHSQYYLLSRNPDESCELDFMGIIQELKGQLEVLDLSQWSWSALTQQALDMIPTEQLLILRFHSRTRIQSPHGSTFLKNCPLLETLEIHAFDSEMLDLDDNSASLAHLQIDPTSGCSSSSSSSPRALPHASLNTLSLTGSVPNVLPAVSDAIRTMGDSLITIDLSAHLDGFLSTKETLRLMDWSTSLSISSIPLLTTLHLHGHLAMTFDAPLLLELCPTLRYFGLAIKSYTSSSFVRPELARVLPRFMVPMDRESSAPTDSALSIRSTEIQKFSLKALELEGPWILTDDDMEQMGEQIRGLIVLNLVGCRFYPARRTTKANVRSEPEDEEISSVARLVERVQDTLRTLCIHRRGLEGKPRRDSTDYSTLFSAPPSPTSSRSTPHLPPTVPSEPVLAFKKRFPNVKLLIREKQHAHSFVLAPSFETLRRIHHPLPPPTARNSSSFSDMLGQPSTPYMAHEFSGQNSGWRRARNAMLFLKRRKVYSPNGFENGQIRSWGRSGDVGGSWRRGFGLSRTSTSLSLSGIAPRFFRG